MPVPVVIIVLVEMCLVDTCESFRTIRFDDNGIFGWMQRASSFCPNVLQNCFLYAGKILQPGRVNQAFHRYPSRNIGKHF